MGAVRKYLGKRYDLSLIRRLLESEYASPQAFLTCNDLRSRE
jgi:hypothetical protein